MVCATVRMCGGLACVVARVGVWNGVWGETDWHGGVAAAMYKGPVSKALHKAYPSKRSFRVLEDNDPSGFKSSKGVKAKEEVKIAAFDIPKRSPDLNVCDYALWKEVNSSPPKIELMLMEQLRLAFVPLDKIEHPKSLF